LTGGAAGNKLSMGFVAGSPVGLAFFISLALGRMARPICLLPLSFILTSFLSDIKNWLIECPNFGLRSP